MAEMFGRDKFGYAPTPVNILRSSSKRIEQVKFELFGIISHDHAYRHALDFLL
jgi:hypothetical protein